MPSPLRRASLSKITPHNLTPCIYYVALLTPRSARTLAEASGEFAAIVSTLYGTASSDNERTNHFVNNIYLAAYGRSATATEMQQGRDSLNAAAAQSQSQAQTATETLGRSLFAGQVSDFTITARQYVTNLYEGFLQRGPDAQGLSFWTTQAGSTAQARQAVLDAFATSPAFRELSGTLYRETFWVVSDHLGTPRMIVDRTGSLAGIKRHDYLPFGEESLAGTGGRATTQGYGASDNVRQKFTGKERDAETNLDYFEARYYCSTQGRFTSPDEFTGGPDELYDFVDDAADNPTFYADISNPQSLNKYQYAYNNPLRYNDPDGHCPECINEAGPIIEDIVEQATPYVVAGAGAIATVASGAAKKVGDWLATPGAKVEGTQCIAGLDCSGYYMAKAREQANQANAPDNSGNNGHADEEQATPSGRTPDTKSDSSNRGGGREGKDFTRKDKQTIIDRNREKNGGKTRCGNCGVETVPAEKSRRGVKPLRNETQVDHITPKSKGGSGTPDNGQVLCRGCNRDKSNHDE